MYLKGRIDTITNVVIDRSLKVQTQRPLTDIFYVTLILLKP
jgi:hypothetical protein